MRFSTGVDGQERIAEYVSVRSDLPRAEAEWFAHAAERRVLCRGDAFREAGRGCGLLLDGVLQVHGTSSRGKKVVLDLLFPGAMALLPGDTGRDASVEAVTTCVLAVWPGALWEAALARHAGWHRFVLRMTEDALHERHERYLATRLLDAGERYARMARGFPPSWRLVPQHLIASYLGITPQYLSRIKRRNREGGRQENTPF